MGTVFSRRRIQHALTRLRQQECTLNERCQQLEWQHHVHTTAAREALRRNNKQEARYQLTLGHMVVSHLKTAYAVRTQGQALLLAIETQEMNVHVIKEMRGGLATMKHIARRIRVQDVEAVRDELEDCMDELKAVSEAMDTMVEGVDALAVVDDALLEEELQRLCELDIPLEKESVPWKHREDTETSLEEEEDMTGTAGEECIGLLPKAKASTSEGGAGRLKPREVSLEWRESAPVKSS